MATLLSWLSAGLNNHKVVKSWINSQCSERFVSHSVTCGKNAFQRPSAVFFNLDCNEVFSPKTWKEISCKSVLSFLRKMQKTHTLIPKKDVN